MKRNEKRAWSRKPENSRILMQMSWTHMNPTSTFILRSFSVLDTQPCRFVWFVVLNVFKLFLFKTKPNTIIYNFSDVFWNLESDSVSKTDHEGVKPNQNQNQEVYCSTKTPSYDFLCNSNLQQWIRLYRAGESWSILKHELTNFLQHLW